RTILKFEHWDFYMEGDKIIGVQRAPASVVSISLAADWLGDRVSTEERAEWISVMGKRGSEPNYLSLYGIRNPREVQGWHFDSTSTFFEIRPDHRTDLNRRPEITQTANLRAVPAAALIIGAITDRLENGSTPDNERWLEMGLFNIEAFGDIFKEDGSYHEGVTYGHYTATQIAQATAILQRHGGIDLRQLINWPGYAQYVLNMFMPTTEDPYEIVNFGDNGNPKSGHGGNMARTSVPAWIARTFDDETAQWLGNNATGFRDHWSLMWYDPDVAEKPPEGGPRLWVSDLDWVVARNGFGADDLVVAMRSGAPANHEHADRNSIIVKCFGEQLVTDPSRPPYLYADPAWRMRLTEGHSAILIDGKGHEHHNGVEGTNASRSYARIVTSAEGDGYAYWKSSATQPYRLVDVDIREVIREIVVLYDVPAVVVVDRMQKFESPSPLEARFFGYNYDGQGSQFARTDGFITTRPGAVMRAHVMSNKGVTVETGLLPIQEKRAARHPFASVITEPGTDVLLVTVLAIGRPDESTAPVSITGGGGGRGSIRVGGRTVSINRRSLNVK
ncbi:MAG: heparinase II/III family protein, partial [Rhodothermia bacterium]